MAKRWWENVWSSPMSFEFLGGDEPALFRLVVLVNIFWHDPTKLDVAREIRLMEREFGLTPMSRRRLEWSVVAAEESKDRLDKRRFNSATVVEGDPRSVLGD